MVLYGDWGQPWQALWASFDNQRSITITGSRAVILALLELEAARIAASYEEGSSTIYIPDAHLEKLLREQPKSWSMASTPAGRIHRRMLNAT